jgi:hypothetical protein
LGFVSKTPQLEVIFKNLAELLRAEMILAVQNQTNVEILINMFSTMDAIKQVGLFTLAGPDLKTDTAGISCRCRGEFRISGLLHRGLYRHVTICRTIISTTTSKLGRLGAIFVIILCCSCYIYKIISFMTENE